MKPQQPLISYKVQLMQAERRDLGAHYGLLAAESVGFLLAAPLSVPVAAVAGIVGSVACGIKVSAPVMGVLTIPFFVAVTIPACVLWCLGASAKGLVDYATQNPSTSLEQKRFFGNLAAIQNIEQSAKQAIINNIIKEYGFGWHLAQSASSGELLKALKDKTMDVDKKFELINKYVLDNVCKISLNNGKKLFSAIQNTVNNYVKKQQDCRSFLATLGDDKRSITSQQKYEIINQIIRFYETTPPKTDSCRQLLAHLKISPDRYSFNFNRDYIGLNNTKFNSIKNYFIERNDDIELSNKIKELVATQISIRGQHHCEERSDAAIQYGVR